MVLFPNFFLGHTQNCEKSKKNVFCQNNNDKIIWFRKIDLGQHFFNAEAIHSIKTRQIAIKLEMTNGRTSILCVAHVLSEMQIPLTNQSLQCRTICQRIIKISMAQSNFWHVISFRIGGCQSICSITPNIIPPWWQSGSFTAAFI